MMEWVGRLGTVLVVGLAFAGVTPGCDGETSSTGDNSETHFLATCDSVCSGGLECICGVCTKRCSEADSCGDLSANASCAESCGENATKICDVTCAISADCAALGAAFGCYDGHCRQSGGDATAGGNGAGGETSSAAGAGGASGIAGAGVVGPGECQAAPDPNPAQLASAELDADVIARAALVFGSCAFTDDGPLRIAEAMWRGARGGHTLVNLAAVQAECLASSRCGCDGISNCLGLSIQEAAGGCTTRCEGDVFVGCSDTIDIVEGYFKTFDCAKYGQVCDVEVACKDADAVTCNGTELSCSDDGRAQYCASGVLRQGPDCAALGLTCVAGRCQGTGAACMNDQLHGPVPDYLSLEGVSCQGGVLEACVEGKLASFNCAEQGPGFDCQSFGGFPFCGLASECVPPDVENGPSSNYVATCNGTELTFCNAGRLEHLDCADFGFTGCDVDASKAHYGCTPNEADLLAP